MTLIKLVFTEVTYFNPEVKEVSTVRGNGKLNVTESKKIIPPDTIYVSKEYLSEEFEVDTEELLKLRIEKEEVTETEQQ